MEWIDKESQGRERKGMEKNEKGEERKTGRGTARKGKEWAGMERNSKNGKD